jgi:hypothetical protein
LPDPDGQHARKFLDYPNRVFLTSPFVHLEVVPKAIFFKNASWFREVDKIQIAAQTEAAETRLPAGPAGRKAGSKDRPIFGLLAIQRASIIEDAFQTIGRPTRTAISPRGQPQKPGRPQRTFLPLVHP